MILSCCITPPTKCSSAKVLALFQFVYELCTALVKCSASVWTQQVEQGPPAFPCVPALSPEHVRAACGSAPSWGPPASSHSQQSNTTICNSSPALKVLKLGLVIK
uniref:Uncharacterized protein n=1 Tax=Falco tinnunculus TaxID=100819 RepID=A0A8C4U018_FALTI